MSGSLQTATGGTVSGLTNNQKINSIVSLLATAIQSGTAPTTGSTGLSSMAGVLWHDTTNNIFKVRDQADTTWIAVYAIDETNKAVAVAAPGGLKNRILNGNFAVNQRGYVSGTALAAGAYAHDMWKAGGAGCTYTFTPAVPDTTITITAGSLLQFLEGPNVEGGNYMLSWTGTAQGRVLAGAYGASPVSVAGLGAGGTPTIEFNTGTVGRISFVPGTTALAFERRHIELELSMCQRYYEVCDVYWLGDAIGTGFYGPWVPFKVQKRVNPTILSLSQSNAVGNGNIGVRSAGQTTVRGTAWTGVSVATVQNSGFIDRIAATADL